MYGERNRELTWNPWGDATGCGTHGRGGKQVGTPGWDKRDIRTEHLGKSQGNSRGNPPFNGRAIKWENLERITGPLDEVFLWPSFFFPQVPGWRVNWSWIFFSFLSVLGFFFLGLGRSHRAKFPLGFFSPLVLVTFIE